MVFCDKEYIGKKFKEYRKKHNYTQEEIAEKIGISDKHYGKLERGVFLPGVDTFLKLIEILNIPIGEFGVNFEAEFEESKKDFVKELYILNENQTKMYKEILKVVKKYIK